MVVIVKLSGLVMRLVLIIRNKRSRSNQKLPSCLSVTCTHEKKQLPRARSSKQYAAGRGWVEEEHAHGAGRRQRQPPPRPRCSGRQSLCEFHARDAAPAEPSCHHSHGPPLGLGRRGYSSSTGVRGGESAWDSTGDRAQGGFSSPAWAMRWCDPGLPADLKMISVIAGELCWYWPDLSP